MSYFLGIRREDINIRERRVPIVPEDAAELRASHSLEFIVQPSEIRIFRDDEYRAAGITVSENICSSPVVLALKEIPIGSIESGKAYVFFSHTTKGQKQNMPMLKRMIEAGCTVIDYEKMVDGQGRRVLYFGNYAGHAGLADSLWALGRRLEIEGLKNPFRGMHQAFKYENLIELKEAVKQVSLRLKNEGLPEGIRPLIFGFMGYGHVSQGAQEVFDLLPFEEVEPGQIHGLFGGGQDVSRVVFKVVFKEKDMVEPVSPDGQFELQDFYRNPGKYRPVFEKFVPYVTVLLNGIHWLPGFPKYITKPYLRRLYDHGNKPRLRLIADITCDVNGSIESTVAATDSENPVYVYEPASDRALAGFEGNGPVVLAVYNLPAELPVESSRFFSSGLKKYVPEIAAIDFSKSLEACGLSEVVRKAVIVYKGRLTPDYEYLSRFLE